MMGNCCSRALCGICYTNCDDIACCQDCCFRSEPSHEELKDVAEIGRDDDLKMHTDLNYEINALHDAVSRLRASYRLHDDKLMATQVRCKQLEDHFHHEKGKRKELKQIVNELQQTMDEFRETRWQDVRDDDELQQLMARGHQEREAMKEDIEHLKQLLEDELRQSQDGDEPSAPGAPVSVASVSEQPRNLSWIVPEPLYLDERIAGVLHQLLNQVNLSINVVPMASASITVSDTGRVLLPCVAASRVGSDLLAAVEKAKLGAVAPIILIFHHLAPHNCRIGVPTKERVTDRSLVEHSLDMIDVVFWNGKVYGCVANEKAVAQLRQLVDQM